MADRSLLVAALLRSARLEAANARPVTTAKALLEGLMRGQFTATVGDGGRVLVSTNQAGRATTWQQLSDLSATEIMALAESAWRLDDELGDDDIPVRRLTRLRVDFTRAIP